MLRPRFVSLRTKLIAAFLVFILFPILGIGMYTYAKFEQVLSGQLAEATAERLRQININISRELGTIVSAANSMMLDEQVQQVLTNPPGGMPQRVRYAHRIDEKFLEVSTAIIFDTVTLTLLDRQGNAYTNWAQKQEAFERMIEAEWYSQLHNENGYMTWVLNHENYMSPTADRMVTLALTVRDRTLLHELGTLVISKPVDNYLQILQAGNEGHFGFIVDGDGNVLSDQPERAADVYGHVASSLRKEREAYTTEIGGEKLEVITDTIRLTGWTVVQVIPHSAIFKDVHEIRSVAFVIFIISATVFITLIVAISFMVTKPLRKLGSVMKQVEEGDLYSMYSIKSKDEIGQLGNAFNHMLKTLRNYLENEINLERSKEQAKLEALQAQINPHFLHNTLNTIKWQSMMAGTRDITEMLLALAHLLNMSINRGQEEITLREELENVASFLTIQKYRFGDTIGVIEEIDAASLAGLVPKLSLQPLVENAYCHGLFITGGTITIRSRLEGEQLCIQVIDEGKDPGKERLEEVNAQLASERRNASFSGIGMNNVHSRIQLMYGAAYGLKLERDERQGVTIATMTIPFRGDDDDHSAGRH